MFYYRPSPKFLQSVKNREIPEEEMQAYKNELSLKNKKYQKLSLVSVGIGVLLILILFGITSIGGNDLANQIESTIITILLVGAAFIFFGLMMLSKLTSNKEILRAIKNAYPKLRDE
ncbi:MAG: hypothetical protein K2L08_04970 [Erysipelotrichaceae bacterium]|nr:hypothetical protein [Erysipelotrichaceae bacterium]